MYIRDKVLRVIRNNNFIGGYFGSERLGWKKAALLLKEGAIGVIPTDTIYGICASALNRKAAEEVYRLKRRDPSKQMIILIHAPNDLKTFGVFLSVKQKKVLEKLWPGKVSVILKVSGGGRKFDYLHRGTKTLAFRLPKNRKLLDILKISGPIVAPSANFEGGKTAKNINEARRYFGKSVFYYGKRTLNGKSSTLVDLRDGIKILRK